MGMIQNDITDVANALIYSEGKPVRKVGRRFIEAGLKLLLEDDQIDTSQMLEILDNEGRYEVVEDRSPYPKMANQNDFYREMRKLVDRGYACGLDHDEMMGKLLLGAVEIGRDHGWKAGDIFKMGIGDDVFSFDKVDVISMNVARVNALAAAAEQFRFYARSHTEKGTEDGYRKAATNVEFAEMCEAAVAGEAKTPENRPETAQESDSGLPVISGAPRLRDVVSWLQRKAVYARKADMTEMANALDELVRSIDLGLVDEAEVDFERSLRLFYLDCHHRNLKAGWWTDLATGQPKKRSVGELFMLFVTELWEAYDAYTTNEMDDKLPHHPGLGVELGDLQIRLADFCGALLESRIVANSNVRNPGDAMFQEVGAIAVRYEAIRKTDAAVGSPEEGDPLPPQDVAAMTMEKLAFNQTRADHQIENRLKDGGKRT